MFRLLLRSSPIGLLSGASTSYSVLSALRGFSSISSPQSQIPSEQHVKVELARMERELRKSSQIDGSKRIQLSSSILTMQIPPHDVEPELMSIDVHVRPDTGSTICKWLRRVNRLPARVISLPNNKDLMIHMTSKDAEKLVREYGYMGCQSRLVKLRVVDPSDNSKELADIRVKPHEVLRNSVTLAVEHVDFLFCPVNRAVRVNVPIRLINSDASAGVRKGAWLKTTMRVVPYECKGGAVPPYIEVDVKTLDVDQMVRVRDLPIPMGTRLIRQDFDAPVVKCTTESGDEIRIRGPL